jgi:hypothetical protein
MPEPLINHLQMKPLFLLLALVSTVFADIPRKQPSTKYMQLVSNSPFTSKPAVDPGPVAGPNPLEDYALIGVAPVQGGFRVTVINRKKPDERFSFDSHRKDTENNFEVISIERKPGNPLGTVVHLAQGSNKGTVEFEPELLTLKTPPPPQQQQQQRPQLPGQPQLPVNPADPNARQPRPRVVQPPVPTPQQPSGGRDNNRRPDRR